MSGSCTANSVACRSQSRKTLFRTRPYRGSRMRIVSAAFPADDPDGLRAWYEQMVGAAPSFIRGFPAPHHFAFHTESLGPWRHRQQLDVTEEHDFAGWDGA